MIYLKDLKFRDWVVEHLSRTGHARVQLADDAFDEFAEKLGVQPDVLAEARAVLKMRLTSAGRQVPRGTRVKGSGVFRLKLKVPGEILRDWKEECSARGCDSTTLFRSVIHAYLQGSAEPQSLGSHWVYQGRRLKIPSGVAIALQASITPAALRTLHLRALELGSTPTAIGRGLILEVLAGKYTDVQLVEPRRMFNDESRYNTPGSSES